MSSTKKTARIAGLLYLVNGVTGFFSIIYIPNKLIVSGNAAATANKRFLCGPKQLPLCDNQNARSCGSRTSPATHRLVPGSAESRWRYRTCRL